MAHAHTLGAGRALIIVLIAAIVATTFGSASAQTTSTIASTTGRVSGTLLDQTNSLPIGGAAVSLYQGDNLVTTTASDSGGKFTFDNVQPGVYTVLVAASGYQNSRSRDFVVVSGQEIGVNLAINRATTTQYKTIATVSVTGANALASTTTITRTIDPVVVQKENNIRLADALYKLPGVNGAGLSSSVGDDTYLNIRGLGESETIALLDGHPVGPQGVYAINGGGTFPTSFNYADTPIYGFNKVQVTFGSGATGLYGVNAVGGTVDMQTLQPTVTPQANFFGGLGSEGRSQSAFSATGQYGKLGYVLAGGVFGTYGLFPPQIVAQTGRPNNNPNLNNGGACTSGNDISQCNLALNTYSVSQNTILKSGLAKLVFNLSNNTSFTSTFYSSGSQADSTGNGDNDNIPYDTRLGQIQTNQTPSCMLPGSSTNNGYTVITDQQGDTSCYTAQQWAAASNGPFGGGEDRNRGTNMADYHFRLASVSGKNTIVADGFYNYYKYYKSSEIASGLDPTGTMFAGTAYSQWLNTEGWLISDDIQNEKSDIGFGYFGETQLGTRLNYNVVGQGLYNYNPPELTQYQSGFVRANFNFSDPFAVFAAVWIKHSSVDSQTSVDPRISLVFRPAATDVLRATFGHSTGDPAAELKASGPPVLTGNPSSLNPSCTPYNTIGSGGNPNIQAEQANDYEVGYAHRFTGDSSIQLNLYYTNVNNQLFSASEPLTQFGIGAAAIPPNLLQGYAAKIGSACSGVDPNNPASVIPFLAIQTTFNVANAVSKGIELTGRQRFTPQFYIDYAYNLQSVVQNGLNDNILMNNPFVINGAQVQGIPMNQANIGVDYANRGFEIRMDGYFIGPNNAKERPAYNTWDGFISKNVGSNATLTLGVSNVFNQDIQNYGYFGHQLFVPENQFFHDTNSIQQFTSTGSGEEFGNVTRSFLLSLTARV